MFATNRFAAASFLLAAASSPASSQQALHVPHDNDLSSYEDPVFSLPAEPDTPDTELSNILSQLRVVILKVQDSLKSPGLDLVLKNVQISLVVDLTTAKTGQIGWTILTVGGQHSAQTTHTMKFTLAPPPPDHITSDLLAETLQIEPQLSTEFTEAILRAAAAANFALKKNNRPALELCTFTANVKFVIKNQVQGGVQVPVFVPITVTLQGQVTPANTQEAILTFTKKENPKECKGAGGGDGGMAN
jgi:hypothetical protein